MQEAILVLQEHKRGLERRLRDAKAADKPYGHVTKLEQALRELDIALRALTWADAERTRWQALQTLIDYGSSQHVQKVLSNNQRRSKAKRR